MIWCNKKKKKKKKKEVKIDRERTKEIAGLITNRCFLNVPNDEKDAWV
jgi:hypothetical protein